MDILTGAGHPEVTRTVAGCGDQWTEEVIARGAAARSLGLIGDERAIPSLVAALEPTFTRAEAAAALAAFGSRVIPFLLPLLNEPRDENLLFHVRETLASAGWRSRRM
jgi:HEAT repeat protein